MTDYNMKQELEYIAFADCHKMNSDEIDIFADCLAKGFRSYPLYEYISGNKYNEKKVKSFWEASLKIINNYGLCYANDITIDSVMVYLPPKTEEPKLFDYIKNYCLKNFCEIGIGPVSRLIKFDNIANDISKRHRNDNCGYLMAIATLPEVRKLGHGKKLLNALKSYLNISHQECYLETLKAGNVALYEHFDFTLKETSHRLGTNLPIFAMHYKSSGVME